MKTFKELIKDINKETKNSGVIPEPIHFKHMDRDITTGSGVIPSPIHFKRVGETNTGSGVIPSPIHFKYVSPVLGSAKKRLRDILESKQLTRAQWIDHDDNEHHHDMERPSWLDTKSALSEKLSKHHKLNIKSDYINMYTDDSEHFNNYLMDPSHLKNKPAHFEDHFRNMHDNLQASIQNNKLKHDNVHAYSGVSFDPEKHVDENGHIRSPAFISATLSKYTAEKFARKGKDRGSLPEKHILHFHLEKDDPALAIRKYSVFPEEHEILISPSKLKYHGHESYHDENGDITKVHKVSIVKE